jgi:hypothetical protein
MVRLHGVTLSADEARKIVQYLGDQHGLAPEEAKPGIYYFEKRHLDQEKYPEVVREACVSCHPYGQAMNWRRTAKEWDLLVNMHIGYFPVVQWNSFTGSMRGPGAPAGPPGPAADTRTPVEKARRISPSTPKNGPNGQPPAARQNSPAAGCSAQPNQAKVASSVKSRSNQAPHPTNG